MCHEWRAQLHAVTKRKFFLNIYICYKYYIYLHLLYIIISIIWYADPGIDKQDPRWIGAWWLGFVVCGIYVTLVSVPMLMFPAKIAGAESSTAANKDKNILSNIKGFYQPLTGVLMLSMTCVCLYVYLYVCMSVCNTITFESLAVESSFLGCRYMLKGYESSSVRIWGFSGHGKSA